MGKPKNRSHHILNLVVHFWQFSYIAQNLILMAEYTTCPNCNAEIKNGMFTVNNIVSDQKTQAINLFTDNKSAAFCDKCSQPLLHEAGQQKEKLSVQAKEQITIDLPQVPVITLQHPDKWDYAVIKLVTAQSVTGEGALTEFLSSFSEAFGAPSTRLANKLKNGEDICISKLRMETIKAGGNAIIGCDIDFAQIGAQERGILMVCMAGTAVKLKNLEVLPGYMETLFSRLNDNLNKIELYNTFNNILFF